MAKCSGGIVLHIIVSSCFNVGRLCGRVQGRDCPSHMGVFLFQCRKTVAKYREGIVLHIWVSSCFSVGRLCGKVQGRDCPSHHGIFLFQCRKTLWQSTGKGLSFTPWRLPVSV